ncbi:hypothetical protein HPP92_003957 [Vanilla planifolia]|uniref:Uncharacterized protein n=1 Tax=Vanilla planifolia TaxID=51239 RepID=A0A835S3Z1_VANPL|nr:hypothetical protein HPP92_003957 [Vanilla planifolia]
MASATAAITRANVLPLPTTARTNPHPTAALQLRLPTATTMSRARGKLVVKSSMSTTTMTNEKVVAGLTATALAMALLIPDIAEAAQPGFSPSLKNFLLSIVSGGVVLGLLLGAVIGVANFDPVKRT